MWQFSFNALPDLPEILTNGKERELLNWLFDVKALHPEKITEEMREEYVKAYQKDGAMSRGFAYYRAVAKSTVQNREFAAKGKLEMPVLALGGSGAVGKGLVGMVTPLAADVQGGEVGDCGHYVMEEQPEAVAARLLEFFRAVEGRST